MIWGFERWVKGEKNCEEYSWGKGGGEGCARGRGGLLGFYLVP